MIFYYADNSVSILMFTTKSVKPTSLFIFILDNSYTLVKKVAIISIRESGCIVSFTSNLSDEVSLIIF